MYYDNYSGEDVSSTNTYSGDDSVAAAGAPDSEDHDGTVYNVIAVGKDPHVDICNLKGWGLRLEKIWMDADYMTSRDTTYFAVYTNKQNGNEQGQGLGLWEYVQGSLRALPYGTESLYWYWLKLPVGNVPFEDYEVYEVKINSGTPVVDEDGNVTNENQLHFHLLRDGETLTLGGTQKGETDPADFTYAVHYTRGEISSESNVRVDTATNDRPGIILKKENWNGYALPGAIFTLKETSTTLNK